MLPFMRALLAHAKLHAFYLVALWLWGGILVVIKWWIMFDLVACALLAVVATAMRMQHSGRSRSRQMSKHTRGLDDGPVLTTQRDAERSFALATLASSAAIARFSWIVCATQYVRRSDKRLPQPAPGQ